MIKKQIKVIEYDPKWPQLFEEAAAVIKNALGDNYVSVQHIGSTSVPGLAAKPKIDIIAEAYECKQSIEQLKVVGYQYKGEWNIPFKYGFTKRDGVEINLHLYEKGYPEVELNIKFRDYLRHNQSACDEYQQLKYTLLSDQDSYYKSDNSLFTGYTLGKDPFIKKIIHLSGFDKLRFLYCSSRTEWEEYHRIRIEEIFSRLPDIDYNYHHPDLTNENHYHFVLCKGATVLSVGHMEELGHDKWGLRILATDRKYQGNGYGKAMLENLEQWCKLCGGQIIHLHSAPEAENFYRKLGYIYMPWDDKSIDENAIDLAKEL